MPPRFGTPLKIYVENLEGRDEAYLIDEAKVRTALAGLAIEIDVTTQMKHAPACDKLAATDVFIGSGFDPKLIGQHAGNLKLVHCTSAGVERYMPLTWLPDGAVLTNSSGVHAEKAGEFGLLALLMLNDKIPLHVASQRKHVWRPALSTPIRGKRVLVYGVGALGGAVCDKAKLLGLDVIGIRHSGESHPSVDRMFRPRDLDRLLPEVDFVVVACPLTPETRNAFGRSQIDALPAHAGLVNISRSAVVDYAALAQALQEERLGGAILDVFDQEPLPADAPWWDVPNLIVIPHVSSDSREGYIERSLAILAHNVGALLAGRDLKNVVCPERSY